MALPRRCPEEPPPNPLVTGEGRFLPNNVEVTSGYVLDASSQVFRFWMTWDTVRDRASLKIWRPAAANPRWDRLGEYQRARCGRSCLTGNVPTSLPEPDRRTRS